MGSGLIDRSNQADSRNLLRSDTPKHRQFGASADVSRTAARYENAIAPRLESTECTEHMLRRACDRRADRAPGRGRAGNRLKVTRQRPR